MAAMVNTGADGGEKNREKNAVKVFVGNLDFKITNEELAALFAPYGSIIGVNLRTDRNTGRPRGFGFVTFEDEKEASAAVSAMSGRTHRDRTLTVSLADLRGSAASDGAGGAAAARPWLTTPDARPSEMRPEAAEVDPNVRDWSVPVVVAKKKTKKKKSGAAAGAAGAAGADKSRSWTSWSGP